ncbi:MAG: hemolysin, partial [Odoribacter sp.]|nr:hemolysin [Odoribacter sp.]
MKILTSKEIAKTENLTIPEGTIISESLLQIIKYNKLNKVYSELHDKDPIVLVESLIEELEINSDIPDDDLKNIPAEGSFITVSNHPYRGIDSMLLFKIIYEKRKDFKILANFQLKNIEPLENIIIPVNTFETSKNAKSSFSGIKEAIKHVREGHCIGIFPTGEGTGHFEVSKVILDKEWQTPALKFIKNAGVPVIPLYFHGTNSRWVHILGKINPILRAARLPSELLSKKNRTIRIRIGTPITVKEQSEFKDISQFGRYLRARVYSLGSVLEVRKFFIKPLGKKKKQPEPLIEPIPREILAEEINKVKPGYELFATKNYSVICAPTVVIPNIFSEIGRQREITFREVGEGTNKSTDIDEYDFYYYHLFIWDNDERKIVGAYRIGKGKEILALYGIKGFYINSLFRLKRKFTPVLAESIELGRSFITKDYQRKVIPLFLLWKGIMVFLLKNSEYRYLIGPVSISNDLSGFSKSLIVEFVKTYFYDEEMAKHIIPRKNFVVNTENVTDRKIFIDSSEKDINKIERIILDIESGYRLPVLLKKYMEINGKIIGFNIDPKFNNCLDGLLILDIYETPPDVIKGLSREMNDVSILERFK